jgi:DNA-binding transcriptional LysR family regulator
MTNPLDLNLVHSFIAVAETLSFKGAAQRLGVTRPAISQAIRRLEDQVGVALVIRTTRSVRLTEAGLQLHRQVGPAVTDVAAALEQVGEWQGRASGTLRLAVSSIAEGFLSGPLLKSFLSAHPGVSLDVMVTDEEFDIVASGFDAGVRLGEVIEQDMIAVPVSSEQRQLIVASPGYVATHGAPLHPRDLPRHACIGWRPQPDVAPYRWEFTEGGQDFDVDVRPRMTTNDMSLMLRMALADVPP